MTQNTATGKPAARLRAEGGYDWGLITIVAALLALGIIMVFSASYAQGLLMLSTPDPFYFVLRQIGWIAVGLVAMIVTMRLPYHFWQRWSVPLMGVALVALLLVMLFGSERFGSQRHFLGGSIQPSEPAKLLIIAYVAAWLASKGARIRSVQVGLVPFAVLMGIVSVLLVAQPDISTAILMVSTASIMFFIAGAELRQLLAVALLGGATFWLVIQNSVHAGGRVTRYLGAIWNPLESDEWQTQRTLSALVNGGLFGQGLGGGEYKLPGSMPVAWSDNIFAVIGEELGLFGALLVVFLFAMLIFRGLRTALRAPDAFGMLLAVGITTLLALQTLLNIAVVVAIAPPTGVTLPFVSYGGSSMVTVLGAVGILLSIGRGSRTAPHGADSQSLYARFNLGWGNGRSRLPRAGRRAASTPTGRRPSNRA
jgi:cell division protein FtsW